MYKKTYKVWMALLNHPNDWVYVPDVAYDANVTIAQVQTILRTLALEGLERDPRDCRNVKLNIDDDECRRLRKKVVWEFNNIDEDMVSKVMGALSNVG